MGQISNNKILIIGGGIGGLTTALALAHRAIASHVLERREQLEQEGAGIQLGPNGTRILVDLGLEADLAPFVGQPEAIAVHNGTTGSLLTEFPLGQWIAERHGAPYWVTHRADLHKTLFAAANANPLIEISTGVDVVGITPNRTGPAIATTQDDQSFSGAAIVCADGLWSTFRDVLQHSTPRANTPDDPTYSGWSAARTVVPVENVPAGIETDKTGVWLRHDAHVVHYPVRAGKELAIVVILGDKHPDRDWNANASRDWIDRGVSSFGRPVRNLITNASGWRKWGLYRRSVAPVWSHHNTALLGDAAHPILPFLAQGAVMAIEDSAILAGLLATALAGNSQQAVNDALRSYAEQRRPRVKRVQQASSKNGEIFHLRGPVALARNLVLRTVSPQRLMARYDWLYGWQP